MRYTFNYDPKTRRPVDEEVSLIFDHDDTLLIDSIFRERSTQRTQNHLPELEYDQLILDEIPARPSRERGLCLTTEHADVRYLEVCLREYVETGQEQVANILGSDANEMFDAMAIERLASGERALYLAGFLQKLRLNIWSDTTDVATD